MLPSNFSKASLSVSQWSRNTGIRPNINLDSIFQIGVEGVDDDEVVVDPPVDEEIGNDSNPDRAEVGQENLRRWIPAFPGVR